MMNRLLPHNEGVVDRVARVGLGLGLFERLSDDLDGELAPDEVSRIEAHVRGCDGSTRFSGRFAAAVQGLRARLGPVEPAPEDVARRLRERLRES